MSRSRYSMETFRKVGIAFRELVEESDPLDRVIMPEDIAIRANISKSSVLLVLRDAAWWNDVRRGKMRTEIARRGISSRSIQEQWTGKGYTSKKFKQAEEAFYALAAEYDPIGMAVMPSDIQSRACISNSTWQAIAKDASWWNDDRKKKMQSEISRKAVATNAAQGYPGLKKGQATLAAQGYQGQKEALKRGCATNAARGYPGLAKGRATSASQGWVNSKMGLKKAHLTVVTRGYPMYDTHPVKIRGRNTRMRIIEALGKLPPNSSLSCIAAHVGISVATAHRHIRLLRDQGLIGDHNDLNHLTVKGNNTRQRIIDDLNLFPDSSLRQRAIRIGTDHGNVTAHLRILRAQGLIDEHNRPIQQDAG